MSYKPQTFAGAPNAERHAAVTSVTNHAAREPPSRRVRQADPGRREGLPRCLRQQRPPLPWFLRKQAARTTNLNTIETCTLRLHAV